MNPQRLLFCIFLLLIALPIGYNLGGPAIFIYDEAIYANNALEMAMHGDPFVLKNNGAISLYNTKPPLMIWLQSLAIRLLGPSEWAIRLPAALAAFGTALLLLLFAHRTLRDYRIGVVAMLVLVTSAGFIRNHVARSGDLDALLVFCVTGYSLLAFDYLLHQRRAEKKYFLAIGFGVFLAFFTKSVAGLMPLLGVALAAGSQRRLLEQLRKPFLYLVGAIVLAASMGYYALRESMAAGYLEKVWFSEYSRFTQNIMPWQEQPFWFYATNMWDGYFMPYLLLLPIALILGCWKKDRLRNFTIMAILFCLSYFLLISYPKVKLNYYDAPLYPMLALLIGVGAKRIWEMLENRFTFIRRQSQLYFFLSLLLLFFMPYQKTWQSIQNNQPIFELEREGFAIRTLQQTQPDLLDYTVLMQTKYEEHFDQARFYIKGANHYKKAQIKLEKDWRNLKPGGLVLCCQVAVQDSLRQHFDLEERAVNECKLFFFK